MVVLLFVGMPIRGKKGILHDLEIPDRGEARA